MFSYFTSMKTFTFLYFVPQHMRATMGVCAHVRRQVRVR